MYNNIVILHNTSQYRLCSVRSSPNHFQLVQIYAYHMMTVFKIV